MSSIPSCACCQVHSPSQEAAPIAWRPLIFALLLAALSEVLELAREWSGIPLLQSFWPALVAALASIFVCGLDTYKQGWLAVRNFNLTINALMSVAVTGAVLIGQFPEAAMVMALFNLSEALEAKALARARNAIGNLMALAPERADTLMPSGQWQNVEITAIPMGGTVRVKPGERVPLDGLITLGRSTINQAPITGESMPVEKAQGDAVYAGTINQAGSFEFVTSSTAGNSTLARIIRAVEQAQSARAPFQRFVDRFAAVYTPLIFLAALLAAVIPPLFLAAPWTSSIYNALVILVIGCPCALVISTPVSIISGMAAAARHGILVKGGVFLEQGRKLALLALDKTGTVTNGTPQQTDMITLESSNPSLHLSLAASLAASSDHPVSRAIATQAAQSNTPLLPVASFTAIPGQGVRGIIQDQPWHLGNQRLIDSLGLLTPVIEEQILALEQQGKTIVALIGPSAVHLLFAVADTIRPGSAAAIRQLHSLGVRTVMLTGDNPHIAAAISKEAGIDDFRAQLLPQDKLDAIASLRAQAFTAMVGDGINDAPALAGADLSFAMAAAGSGTAIETADIALMDDDLGKIPRFIRISRTTYAILVQNISLALFMKALFFTLALTGYATMWMAVFADVGTSLFVVLNGLRASRA